MFIAALLDAFPEHEAGVLEAIRLSSGPHPVYCALKPHRDHVLRGRRFEVRSLRAEEREQPDERVPEERVPARSGPAKAASLLNPLPLPPHEHVSWKSIRARIAASPLDPEIRRHALAIFELLAGAEAHVHGVAPDEVEFHEVGAWDSVADIVGASALIAALGAARWTASAAPLGGGRIKTAHGILPVPAPATTQLLMGLPTLDDGIDGERVTPTGAAILRYLCPPGSFSRVRGGAVRILMASGTGFGTRTLKGLSNHLRVLSYQAQDASSPTHRQIHVLEFEVDDQSGEDLALGLDRIRSQDGVLDVTQSPVFGKKGRMMIHVQVLARDGYLDCVMDACFRETTTIGLRHRPVSGVGLSRNSETVDLEGRRLRVKIVERPGGRTAKAESDDVAHHADHALRARLRRRAESTALRVGETALRVGESEADLRWEADRA
jgi:uncharacterized protein (TIGR00299 family) protein